MRRVALLLNPIAGAGCAGREAAEIAAMIRELAGEEIELYVTEEPGHAVQIARDVRT